MVKMLKRFPGPSLWRFRAISPPNGRRDRCILSREIERSVAERQIFWKRDFSSAAAYEKSVEPNRERLRKIIGATDARLPVVALELVGSTAHVARIAERTRSRFRSFDGRFLTAFLARGFGFSLRSSHEQE